MKDEELVIHGLDIRQQIIDDCKKTLEKWRECVPILEAYIEKRKAEEDKKKLH